MSSDWPHIPRKLAEQRLAAGRDIDEATGCHLWRGCRHRTYGFVHLTGRRSTRKISTAHQLAWWVVHGERPALPRYLKRTCATKFCINPEHHTIAHRRRDRRWTAQEARALREQYWGTQSSPGLRPTVRIQAHGITQASRHFGVCRAAVQRAFDGHPVRLNRWPSRPSLDSVLSHVRSVDRTLAEPDQGARARLTMESLAQREGVGLTAVSKMLKGTTYKMAGGPTAPVARSKATIRPRGAGLLRTRP